MYKKRIAERIKDEPKLFWKFVREKRKTNISINILEKPDGHMTENNLEVADTLNNQFTSVFKEENIDNIPQLDEHEGNNYRNSINN